MFGWVDVRVSWWFKVGVLWWVDVGVSWWFEMGVLWWMNVGVSRWVEVSGCLLLFRFGHWSVRGTASGCPALTNSGSH